MITLSHMKALNAIYNSTDESVRGIDLVGPMWTSYSQFHELEEAGLISSEPYGPDDGSPRGRVYKITEEGEKFAEAVQEGSYKLPSTLDVVQVHVSHILRPLSLIVCGALGAKGMWWDAVAAILCYVFFNWYINRAEERWL